MRFSNSFSFFPFLFLALITTAQASDDGVDRDPLVMAAINKLSLEEDIKNLPSYKALVEIVQSSNTDEIEQMERDWPQIKKCPLLFPLESIHLAITYLTWEKDERSLRLKSFLEFHNTMTYISEFYRTFTSVKHEVTPFFRKMSQLSVAEMLATRKLLGKNDSPPILKPTNRGTDYYPLNPIAAHYYPEKAPVIFKLARCWTTYLYCCSKDERDRLAVFIRDIPIEHYNRLLDVDPEDLMLNSGFFYIDSLLDYIIARIQIPDSLIRRIPKLKDGPLKWKNVKEQLDLVQRSVEPFGKREEAVCLWLQLVCEMGTWPDSFPEEYESAIDEDKQAFFRGLSLMSAHFDVQLLLSAFEKHDTPRQKALELSWLSVNICMKNLIPDSLEVMKLAHHIQRSYVRNLLDHMVWDLLRNMGNTSQTVRKFADLAFQDKHDIFLVAGKDETCINNFDNYRFLLKKSGSIKRSINLMHRLITLLGKKNEGFLPIKESIIAFGFNNVYEVTRCLTQDNKRVRMYAGLDMRGYYESMESLPETHRRPLAYLVADLYTAPSVCYDGVQNFHFEAIRVIVEDKQLDVLQAYMDGLRKNLKKLQSPPYDVENLLRTIAIFPPRERAALTNRILRKHKDFDSLYKALQLLPSDKINKVVLQAKNLSDIYAEIFAPESLFGRLDAEDMNTYLTQLVKMVQNGNEQLKEDMEMFIQRENCRSSQAPNRGIPLLVEALNASPDVPPSRILPTRIDCNSELLSYSGTDEE